MRMDSGLENMYGDGYRANNDNNSEFEPSTSTTDVIFMIVHNG